MRLDQAGDGTGGSACLQTIALSIDTQLCEAETASFWGNRLLYAAKDEKRREEFLEALRLEMPNPSHNFAEELLDHLYDEENSLPKLKSWFEASFKQSLTDAETQDKRKKISEQTAISNAIVSLITLKQLSWQEIFEKVSTVDILLREDPSQIYPQMDFATRDSYRHSIEKLAHNSSLSEQEVAKKAIEMSCKGYDPITSSRRLLPDRSRTSSFRKGHQLSTDH